MLVIYSPGYGAGWSTCGDPNSCLDQELAKAIYEKQPFEVIQEIAKRNWPDQYDGGLYQCKVVNLESGTRFRVQEYDGSESIELDTDPDWLTA